MLTALFVLSGLFGLGLLAIRLFVPFGLAGWFFLAWLFAAEFFASLRFTAWFFAPVIRAAFLFAARQLDTAQGAAERFDFALVVVLLMLGKFDKFEDFFHLLESVFERFYDMADFARGFGDGGKVLFLARFIGGRAFDARRRRNGPFLGNLLLYSRRLRKVFRGCGGGCSSFFRSGFRR